ncbi:MAG: leucyl/phenylalanyl-tRNA--protein transferase [Burkholderiaceae bacterium]|nr:leucyl/phenylalanyl-tRNA--protein transferase [Burkholderiaceae bacterium]
MGPASPAPGLLAAGGCLDVPTLTAAYAQTIFPWFNAGEPILWWSPDPRMVLAVQDFRLHRSLRKRLRRFQNDPACAIRIDSDFERVIRACSEAPRSGQSGTWIGQDMIAAYLDLHAAGHAHSVETWAGGQLVAGLYCVSVGRAVFGESMFTRVADGSKIAIAALVAFCRAHGLPLIDCQQRTPHLASLGAREIPRQQFLDQVTALSAQPAPASWQFQPVYWNALMPSPLSYAQVDAP